MPILAGRDEAGTALLRCDGRAPELALKRGDCVELLVAPVDNQMGRNVLGAAGALFSRDGADRVFAVVDPADVDDGD